MSWREELLPGSFRGIPFEVDASSLTAGRRIVGHEFPGNDLSTDDDMGRRPREFKLDVYFGGESYLFDRNLFLQAVEQKGPGLLIHPWYGPMTVRCLGVEAAESNDARGICRMSVSFREQGLLTFPTYVLDLEALVADVVDAVNEAASLDFLSVFDVLFLPGEIALAAIDTARGLVQGVTAAVFGPAFRLVEQLNEVGAALDALGRDLEELVSAPSDLAARFAEVFGLIDDRKVAQKIAATTGQVVTLDAAVAAAAPATPTAETIVRNGWALDALVRRTALARAAQLAAAEDFDALDDAVAVRDTLVALLAAELDIAVDNDVFGALTDLQARFVERIEERSSDLARVRTIELAMPQCSLVLAHELYGDATREAEIVRRNGASHPGFLHGALQVLSS